MSRPAAMQAALEAAECFTPDEAGFIRHWLFVGPQVAPYEGDAPTEEQVRREVIDARTIEPPAEVALGAPGPFGRTWRFYQPGRNIFMEQSSFYHQLSRLEMIAATDLAADAQQRLGARLWTPNTVDVWLNGEHLLRYSSTLRRKPDVTSISLPLRAGRNRVVARVQELAARECPFLIGLQVLQRPEAMRILLPGEPQATAQLAAADRWFAALRADGPRGLAAPAPPPFAVTVRLCGGQTAGRGPAGQTQLPWPVGQAALAWEQADVFSVDVTAEVLGQRLARSLEFPAARTIAAPPARSEADHHRACLAELAHPPSSQQRTSVMAVLARHLLGEPDVRRDARALAECLDWIDARPDCADFPLAAVVRLYALGWGSQAQRRRIRRTMLAFRYWHDEPGSDAMCFGSENHSLLFHASQYVAGRLLPEDCFTNTGRSGRQQADIGRQRCEAWLDARERHGFCEFLSGTYFPLTMAALMNLVDLADDAGISGRAAALVDEMLGQLAEHSFDGVTVGPQGRVYRGIVYPHTSGAQGMLSFAVPQAVEAQTAWAVFLAASPTYRPPGDLAERMRRPVSKAYRQSYVRIRLHKTAHYMLSSVEVPFAPADAWGGEPLRPGQPGYQQHLWHAALGRGCHVFVNHPGASFDLSQARPGFWYGNGVLPRLRQEGACVAAIYAIPQTHPIQFTHAHWPSDAFDRCQRRGNWHFGAKGQAYVALWCSRPTRLESEVLTDRELRADGARAAWVCTCSSREEAGDFEAFVGACQRRGGEFDPETLTLRLPGQDELRWP